MQHDIVDNRTVKLVDTIKSILPNSQAAKFAVGYFFLSGLEAVEEELEHIDELRLLIGNTTNRETIEQIAEGYYRLREVGEKAEELTYPKRAYIRRAVDETANNVAQTLAVMDQTDEAERLVSTLARLIAEGRLKVRVYTKGRLHAKAYIFDYPADVRYEKGIAIVGSSNFTLSGVTHNTELNVIVAGNGNHAELTRWFEELWAEGEDFDAALMDELESSWARAEVTPYEIYLKTLYELTKERLDEDETPVWTGDIMGVLTDFQARAVQRAIQIIHKFGGCFVSDVVGLGKSYIGAAIVKYFERTERVRPLIICPAPLVDNWERYNEVYQLNARVLSMGMLREDEDGGNLLLDDVRFRDRDFVLVDESHNFRHTNTQRYRVLESFLAQGRRCVFLTATPRNKSIWDIYYQLKLFHQDDRTELPVDPPNLRDYFKLVERGERSLPALLSTILIRRTRNHILRWYGYDKETHQPVDPAEFEHYQNGKRRAYVMVGGRPNYFPHRELHTVQYSIEETYQGLYQQLRAYMGAPDAVYGQDMPDDQLAYARYGLWRYVKPELQDRPPYAELQRAGINLRGLMRVSMFKRFESSVYAFRETLRRQLTITENFRRALEEGIVAAGEDAQNILYESDRYEDDALLEALEEVSGRYDIRDFNADLLYAHVQQDSRILSEMLEIVEPITPERDDKLQTLISVLMQPPLNIGKCLIFTQYADTAQYLHEQLREVGEWPEAEVVYSDRKGQASIIGRFAPRANPELYPPGTPEIDLLVATDVLSEGLNLQDCDKIINYDLHWNPVRLIQRFGRIDRIGSEHDVIYGYNFLPETALDKHLGLRDKLSIRIQEIHDTIGEDDKILDQNERLNEAAMYAIYEGGNIGVYEEDGEEDLVGLEEAEEIIRQLERDNPELYERIANMRDGVRCGRQGDGVAETYVYCRAGQYQQLTLLDEQGEILSREIPYILGRLRCEPTEPALPLPPSHNATVTRRKRQFEDEARKRQAESQRAVSLSRAQNYVLRELRLFYGQSQDSEELSAKIEALESAFRQPLSRTVQGQLRDVQRQGLSGEVLVERLVQIYERHNLSESGAQAGTGTTNNDNVPRVVCSLAFRE
ncbi:MAG TPA: phospholipase D-like domain-containing protein [Aggregatilineales bacterium]|nr:phospholipase D-like domain-containing protein [Aggregatilineales bacterium]